MAVWSDIKYCLQSFGNDGRTFFGLIRGKIRIIINDEFNGWRGVSLFKYGMLTIFLI